MATLQKHTNKNFNKKEKYVQTTLTRLAGDKCIGKGVMYMNLKNRVTNKVNNKALSTYKETVQHKHATLTMLMWLLVICLSLTMLIMLPTTNYKTNTMAIGTAENPDLTVDSVADLLALSTQTGEFAGSWGTSNSDAKYIKLTTDLVVTANDLTQNDNGTYNWNPIGNDSNPFYGTFDGNGYAITFTVPITIDARYVGLFGYTDSNSVIQNLGVNWQGGLNVGYTGNGASVGGIVGSAHGTITNCYNTGSVNDTEGANNVGGIVGDASGEVTNCYNEGTISGVGDGGLLGGIVGYLSATITNCYNKGEIIQTQGGGDIIGGLVGGADYATISSCYNMGTIRSEVDSDSVGGIIGLAEFEVYIDNCYNVGNFLVLDVIYMGGISGQTYGGCSITNCYNNASVNFIDFGHIECLGGIVGKLYEGDKVINCFNVLEINSSNSYIPINDYFNLVGGIVAQGNSEDVINCYYDVEPSSVLDNDYGDQIESSSLSGESSLSYFQSTTNWSSANAWSIDAKATSNSTATWTIVDGINYGYPILTAFYEYYAPSTSLAMGGSTYLIQSAEDLKYLSQTESLWNAGNAFRLTTDIEYKDEWTPIGSKSTPFIGDFDGGGHVITFTNTITIDASQRADIGFFGTIIGGIVDSLGINWMNGLVAYINQDSYAYDELNIGGLIGGGHIIEYSENDLIITKCFVDGEIKVKLDNDNVDGYFCNIGGILASSYSRESGYGYYVEVVNCYNIASISVESSWIDGLIYIGGISGFDPRLDPIVDTVGECYSIVDIQLSARNLNIPIEVVGVAFNDGYADCGVVDCFTLLGADGNAIANEGGLAPNIYAISDGTSISNCYYDSNLQNNLDTEAQATENLSALVKDSVNFETGGALASLGWSFTSIWGVNPNYNDGLPALREFYDNYTITYQYSQNDTSQNQTQTINQLDQLEYTNTYFPREGYTYTRWTDGTNFYNVGDIINISSNITLWPAEWVEVAIDFTITLNQSTGAGASTPNNVFVYLVVNDSVVKQSFLSNGLVLSASATASSAVSIIVIGGYMTNVTLTGDNGTQVGNKFELDMSAIASNDMVTITYIVTAPSSGSNFNNSIVI